MDPVRDLVQRAHTNSQEARRNRRLETQSSRRNLAREDFNGVTAIQAAEKYNSQNIKKILNKEMKKQPQYGL